MTLASSSITLRLRYLSLGWCITHFLRIYYRYMRPPRPTPPHLHVMISASFTSFVALQELEMLVCGGVELDMHALEVSTVTSDMHALGLHACTKSVSGLGLHHCVLVLAMRATVSHLPCVS